MKGTRAEIYLDALKHNFLHMRDWIPQDVKIAGIVKANAYGHDLVTIAKALVDLGVDYLGVAMMAEARAIRRHEPNIPILIMGRVFETDYDEAIKLNITLTISSAEEARRLNLSASLDEKKVKVHLKFDSGFNRLGFKTTEDVIDALEEIQGYDYIEVEGLFTHLALKDVDSDEEQFRKFDSLLATIADKGWHIPIKHACDSIGAVAYPNNSYSMVRLGAILYGYCSRKTPFKLKPVMHFKTNITRIVSIKAGEGVGYDYTFVADRPSFIGTIPVGYADGLPRNLSNKGFVTVHGKPAKIVGLMCMDQCMIDLTDHLASDQDAVQVGDEVILFDDMSPNLTEVAECAMTNRNELLTRIALRVPRIILQLEDKPKIIQYLDFL